MSANLAENHAVAGAGNEKPRLDLQLHLRDLEEQGLLRRIDRPINKDTELHPLVRWQFLGGMSADERRAFLFTNVTRWQPRRAFTRSAWAKRSRR